MDKIYVILLEHGEQTGFSKTYSKTQVLGYCTSESEMRELQSQWQKELQEKLLSDKLSKRYDISEWFESKGIELLKWQIGSLLSYGGRINATFGVPLLSLCGTSEEVDNDKDTCS